MRTRYYLFTLVIFAFVSGAAQAQSQGELPTLNTRPRTVTGPGRQAQTAIPAEPRPSTQSPTVDLSRRGSGSPRRDALPATEANNGKSRQLAPRTIHARIGEAERLLKTRPRQTSITSPALDFVTLAVLDQSTGRVHLVSLAKQAFLTRGAEVTLTTSLGTLVTLRVLRANGVNTAVTVADSSDRALVPLVIEFPIEKQGVFREMAYYTSAHPALLSPELFQTGQSYVQSMVELAAKRLREKGLLISQNVVDVAERLCVVEHIDHERFRQENHAALFQEIYSLYALNELDTYRYSVSFAGAGGLVQMIPWAYNLERQRHPVAGLNPDFVLGMRNHANALQAMLLYMQDTWSDLAANGDVKHALDAKIATPTELIAAGYNSNASRLPLYIRRGGASWRTLIPRETQVYLQIYRALEGVVSVSRKPTKSQESDRERSKQTQSSLFSFHGKYPPKHSFTKLQTTRGGSHQRFLFRRVDMLGS